MVTFSSSETTSTIITMPEVFAAWTEQLISRSTVSRPFSATKPSASITPMAADSVGVASPP